MACYNEAVEVKSEDALEDLTCFVSLTEEIRNIMQKIAQLKAKMPDRWKESIQELRMEGSFHFLSLKKLNRMAQIRCKNAKDSTLEAKQKLDGNNLRLQNLQYEISHLDREINSCLQFKSKHEDIELVSVDEFYQQAPKEITRENETRQDEHLQTLARLDWELENRKSLKEELQQSHETKEKMCEGIKKRKHDLDSLRPSLETILKSTMPLQEALGDHFTETRALHNNACLLPQPLYVLFVQAKAFSDTCDHDTEVQIGGDLDLASKLKTMEMKSVIDATALYKNRFEDESDSDNEEDQENQRQRRKSTSAAKAPSVEPMDDSSSTNKHPLYVSLKIYLESKATNSSYLLLRFYYYTEREFVTVIPVLELSSSLNDIKKNPVTASSFLLHDLQQEDKGAAVALKAANQFFNEISLGDNERAYLWAQKLAGLEVTEDGNVGGMRSSFSNMRLIIKLIRKRVAARLSLAKQLHSFSSGAVLCAPEITEKFAPLVHFKLGTWKRINFDEYSQFYFTSGARELKIVSPTDYFYSATIHRGSSASVEATVVLSDRYPRQWPLFNIEIQWRGNHTAENNLNVREIEVEVNCKLPHTILSMKKFRNDLLSAQMYRLLSLLDVYVETDCNKDGSDMPSEFPTSKLCPRTSKGRARLKPFKYNSRHKFQCY